MGTYSASLRAAGETTGLPATVQLENGQLSIAAGDHDIGTWALADIELEPVPNGYRMAAEGDQIIIEVKELDAFQEALSSGRFKRRYKLRGKEKKAAKAESSATEVTATQTAQPVREKKPAKPKKEKRAKAKKSEPIEDRSRQPRKASSDEGLVDRGLAMLDNAVEQSQKRFGPYLPNWLFSRGAFVVLFLVLVLLLLFPTILIIIGGVIIAVGAVAYSDPVLASKVLPGRTQPPHALIGGVGILLLGVIVGIITS